MESQALLCHLPLQAARSLPSLQPGARYHGPSGILKYHFGRPKPVTAARDEAPRAATGEQGPQHRQGGRRGLPPPSPGRRCAGSPRSCRGGPGPCRRPPRASPRRRPATHARSRSPRTRNAVPKRRRSRSGSMAAAQPRPRHGPAAGGATATWPPPERAGRAAAGPAAPSQDGTGWVSLGFPRSAFLLGPSRFYQVWVAALSSLRALPAVGHL